jgi:hypothetical protein
MDWVEDRARKEAIISAAVPELFDDLCIAFEEAVKSMARFYPEGPTRPEYTRICKNRAVVRVRKNGSTTECTLSLSPISNNIWIGVGISRAKYKVTPVVVNGRAHLAYDRDVIDPDRLCRIVLEPLFFPEEDDH